MKSREKEEAALILAELPIIERLLSRVSKNWEDSDALLSDFSSDLSSKVQQRMVRLLFYFVYSKYL